MNRVHFSSQTDNWKTPEKFYQELHKEFNFDYDPCPLENFFGGDGLRDSWGKSNFVNPPYSEIAKWVKKGYEESLKGKTVIFLIPSRTDTKWWHEYVMKAQEIRFIKGRLRFGDAKKDAPFPSCIVIFKAMQN